ncbi:hypothetical protein QYE76_016875 [Lolium multiflorum]|uniref:Reverse transcriptase RNase H-like domain-containing protein n=1 Tax=Lolium multiflorum TaxID=4521 RepID=A0AAD8PHY2_LOLMU|nr:hypothetical protein QYE76_016875 [Lolium multiflorum]
MALVKTKSDDEFQTEQQQAFDDIKRRMLDAETRYPEVEKLCLCLFFTCTKLHHILLTAEIFVICKSDVVKHMLSAPVLKGRLGTRDKAYGKWSPNWHGPYKVVQALKDPNLRAITALVVILGTLIGTAADGLLVATPVALYGSFIPVFIVAAVIGPTTCGGASPGG